MKNKLAMMIILLLIYGLSAPANALNWRFLKYSPISFFNDEDWRLLRETGQDALDSQADGAAVSWENPQTRNSGRITLIKTYEANGTTCRQVEVVNHGGGQTGTSVFNFCRNADGNWQLAPD
jgi:surface antigen